MRNPFQKFPEQRGPLKLLVYGDPGVGKTRRALQMPGPLYVIDLENGAADYGELVDPGRDFYLPTKSHSDVHEALTYLATLKPGDVGTLVIDPITVVWQSIQQGHIERQVRKKGGKVDPEEVLFDVSTWGKLKRTYGDILTSLLAAPYHVVMVARGKERTDERGNTTGYGYEGEKSTDFLANVVIEARRDHDVIVKDRTGTYPAGTRQKRIPYTSFLGNTTAKPHAMQSDTEAAERDAGVRPQVDSDEPAKLRTYWHGRLKGMVEDGLIPELSDEDRHLVQKAFFGHASMNDVAPEQARRLGGAMRERSNEQLGARIRELLATHEANQAAK